MRSFGASESCILSILNIVAHCSHVWFRERAAFQNTVETSVYVRNGCQGRGTVLYLESLRRCWCQCAGIGKDLYTALLKWTEEQNFKTAVAGGWSLKMSTQYRRNFHSILLTPLIFVLLVFNSSFHHFQLFQFWEITLWALCSTRSLDLRRRLTCGKWDSNSGTGLTWLWCRRCFD